MTIAHNDTQSIINYNLQSQQRPPSLEALMDSKLPRVFLSQSMWAWQFTTTASSNFPMSNVILNDGVIVAIRNSRYFYILPRVNNLMAVALAGLKLRNQGVDDQ